MECFTKKTLTEKVILEEFFRTYFPCFQTALYLPKQIWVMGEATLISIQCLALRDRQA